MNRSLLIAAAAALPILSGCALLSSPDPVQMYHFGGQAPAEARAPIAQPVAMGLRRIEMPQASRTDRIVGVTGSEVAYIKGARWVSPADDLYTEALENAFAARAQRVRLVGPRELTTAERSLDVDMRAFEARYDAPGAAPSAVITARAQILSREDRSVVAEQTFSVSRPASENRVSAIVQAFEAATADINAQIVDWADQNAG
ncbi:MAG: ABC-type transport auxiliary lipoprotein family protein [Brevundimonas sp.]|uniref:ABC-type transport auxiliary lipoprotein family protein n=1 Tax=Brevundimonas sp. TaxID=1871086 RepID=UPI0039196A4D